MLSSGSISSVETNVLLPICWKRPLLLSSLVSGPVHSVCRRDDIKHWILVQNLQHPMGHHHRSTRFCIPKDAIAAFRNYSILPSLLLLDVETGGFLVNPWTHFFCYKLLPLFWGKVMSKSKENKDFVSLQVVVMTELWWEKSDSRCVSSCKKRISPWW